MSDEGALNAVLAPLTVAARLASQQAPQSAATWRYRSFAELVLAEGVVGTTPTTDVASHHRRGPSGRCFSNASSWSRDDGLIYAEGYAATARVPFGVEHAWCLTGTGIVLDPTWPPGLGVVYIGIAVTSAYRSSIAESSLLHPHPAGLALLRDGLPDHARVPAFDGWRLPPRTSPERSGAASP